MTEPISEQWNNSRHGSHAGRGFHYQDAVITYLAILGWAGKVPWLSVTPEGHEDVSIRSQDGWIHAQIKSRRSHRSGFAISEVAEFLAAMWAAHESRLSTEFDGRLLLVLERPVTGLKPLGWLESLSSSAEWCNALSPYLTKSLGSRSSVAKLLTIGSITEVADPEALALSVLSGEIELPRQASAVHYHQLKDRIGEAADVNGVRGINDPMVVTVADIQRILDLSTELVDVEALEIAIRQGICEVANFITADNDPHFYQGVDVVPGHVVAGLPIERTQLQEELLDRLVNHGAVLVVGPSGAGKSALAWMSAYASRHLVQWYRVRRLSHEDVNPLLRTIRALGPTKNSPIGLVVDNLGQANREGWEELFSEAQHIPGLYLLGVVREEDLPLVASGALCDQVRPALDEVLAERIWSELRAADLTHWAGWREPFEQSNGLLLEYGHILTTGERLQNTIAVQIGRRYTEHRDLELSILRLVGSADTWGARITIDSVRQQFPQVSPDDLGRALRRLVAEHLVRESANELVGLHRVRSRHIMHETHRLGVPALAETIATTLSLLGPESLQAFVTGVLVEEASDDSALLESLCRRIEDTADPALLIASLHALRLVSFIRMGSAWCETLQEEAVPTSKRLIAAQFAILGLSLDLLLPSIQSALERMALIEQSDLRSQLLQQLSGATLNAVVPKITQIEQATALFATLYELEPTDELLASLRKLEITFDGAEIDQIGELLASIRSFSSSLASRYAATAGGTQRLLELVADSKPWAGSLCLDASNSEEVIVSGEIRVVSPAIPDPHEQVMDLCKLLLNCIPEADVAKCSAVDITGALLGFDGYVVADKRIPRKNLPPVAEVAWNRSRIQVMSSLLGAQSQTDTLYHGKAILAEAARAFRTAVDLWCRGQKLPLREARSLVQVVTSSSSLPPLAADSPSLYGPLEHGKFGDLEPISVLTDGLVNAIGRLYDDEAPRPALAAFLHDTLLDQVTKLSDENRWRLLPDSPQLSIDAIRSTLADLFAIVAELHVGGTILRQEFIRVSRQRRNAVPLQVCAELSRKRAYDRLGANQQQLTEDLASHGYRVEVFRRIPSKQVGFLHPLDELAIVVPLDSIFDWVDVQLLIVQSAKQRFEPNRPIVAVPSRHGRTISWLGGRIMSGFCPSPESVAAWEADLPFGAVADSTSAAFWATIDCLVEVSGIYGHKPSGDFHSIEDGRANELVAAIKDHSSVLTGMLDSDQTGMISDALDFLSEVSKDVQSQIDLCMAGEHPSPSLALAFTECLRGTSHDVVDRANLIRHALLEWDVDPGGALTQLDRVAAT